MDVGPAYSKRFAIGYIFAGIMFCLALMADPGCSKDTIEEGVFLYIYLILSANHTSKNSL